MFVSFSFVHTTQHRSAAHRGRLCRPLRPRRKAAPCAGGASAEGRSGAPHSVCAFTRLFL